MMFLGTLRGGTWIELQEVTEDELGTVVLAFGLPLAG